MSRLGEASARVLLVAGSLVVALVLLEGVLQVAARFVEVDTRTQAGRDGGHAHRALFLGDSNTYGLYVGREKPFPRLFEEGWRAAGRGAIDAVNLGWPGTNSSLVMRNLADYIANVRSDVSWQLWV